MEALAATASVHDSVTWRLSWSAKHDCPRNGPAWRPYLRTVCGLGMKLPMRSDDRFTRPLLEDRYRGVIHQSDLSSVNPYNTYQHTGLPPGPIANPGVSSIRAALSPEETPYLFFVAKADGLRWAQFFRFAAGARSGGRSIPPCHENH